ncbi:MAG: hypothetical protein UY48_C0013G0009 [Candidatus Gottesmanbacteria bacterium GW2011_GWB1_49_7]|uniref:Uncharacterized protein n=1 Tax=Candidatus Gottesmanbacteria bacterium GW2011_GWB1_49_7 TaxID=1618448 RepID=A0A0G1VZ33_9BACT|nr:MAG: hypothetical protein UY48_C0013G0009 [Candidatus Gottesmanbacteria bacterium GW2011_GWB1_49_7]
MPKKCTNKDITSIKSILKTGKVKYNKISKAGNKCIVTGVVRSINYSTYEDFTNYPQISNCLVAFKYKKCRR